MKLWIDLLLAVAVALCLTVVFVKLLRRVGPWGGAVSFFLIVTLVGWAAGTWIAPMTPTGSVWTLYWMPFAAAGFLAALLLAATGPRIPPRERDKQPAPADEPERVESEIVVTTVGAYVWVLAIGLLLAAISRHLGGGPGS